MSKNISVWFFTGVLMAFYGVVILGYGLLGAPPVTPAYMDHNTAEWVKRAPVCWGVVLLLFGVVYSIKFFPKDDK
jgi:hypothetical protein